MLAEKEFMQQVQQDEVCAHLADPASYDLQEPVQRCDTHSAIVFLAGKDVYKIKRQVRFSFLDFSTLDKRKVACEREVEVNRAFAPDIYYGVVPITREGKALRLGGPGTVVEWAVHMRRFDETQTLDRILEKGAFPPKLIDDLAVAIGTSHKRARIGGGKSALDTLKRVATAVISDLRASEGIFEAQALEALDRQLASMLAQHEGLLLRRGLMGKVRRCHGDLHLRNIVYHGGAPILFDALEFDEDLATIDIFYDLAFLLMDLCSRHMITEANELLNSYIALSEDIEDEIEGLALLPLFLVLRAAVSANVAALQAGREPSNAGLIEDARRKLEICGRFSRCDAPLLVAVGGLSGSGKSFLSSLIRSEIGTWPGALHLRSDVERKRLLKCAQTSPLPRSAYGELFSVTVYARLQQLSRLALKADWSVVVDATFLEEADRQDISRLAGEEASRFVGLWLEAPPELLIARLEKRRSDVSDANVDVITNQLRHKLGEISWHRIDAAKVPERLKAEALALIDMSKVAENERRSTQAGLTKIKEPSSQSL